MRNYIILNGVNSNTITGLLISTLPPITKPKIRTQTEEIDGRDGDIVTKLGYSAYEKEFQIGLYGDFDIDEVIAYFNSEGTVVFSNEEDKYYNYQILDQIDYEKLIRFKTASVKMHVQPFKYPLEEEQIQVDATVVSGEGSNISLQYTNPNTVITSEIEGDTYQKTTTGKNLLPFPYTQSTITQNGVTFTANENGTILVNGTASGGNASIKLLGNYQVDNQKTIPGKYLSGGTNTIRLRALHNENGNYTVLGNDAGTGAEIDLSTYNTGYIEVTVYNGTTVNNQTIKPMVLNSLEDTTYEEYTGGIPSPNPDYPQEIEVVTGEQSITVCGKNFYNKDIFIQGTWQTSSPANRIVGFLTPTKAGQKYTVSLRNNELDFAIGNTTKNVQSGNTQVQSDSGWQTGTYTYTITGDGYLFLQIKKRYGGSFTPSILSANDFQVELGETATDYQPYQSQSYTINLGSTELCKIGDYQDRIYQDEGTWYIEKQIDKVALNGSDESNWNYINTCLQSKNEYPTGVILPNASRLGLSTRFICKYYATGITTSLNNGEFGWNSGKCLTFKIDNMSSKQDYLTWLSNNNTIIYYILATPTATEITDTTLLEQLEALSGATTYENTTNISVTGSLPAILKATTQGMPKTIINNIGNIYAKPLITIYGSGNIGVYLNQIQVLQIALGDSGSITIDVSKMEAYNKNTQALMNRLVTGDYMEFLINSGENEIAFSGNVAGFTMDNYTRWL